MILFFNILDSLKKEYKVIPTLAPIVKQKWDSLSKAYNWNSKLKSDIKTDYKNISAQYLINNIDLSYKLWKTSFWNKDLRFEQFCEYLLPYRIGSENLQPWRDFLYKKFQPFRDTVKFKNRHELASKLNFVLKDSISLNRIVRAYPYDMDVYQMEKAGRGACRHLVYYTAMVMRANGIPVGIDESPLWGDLDRGHHWNTVLMENGKNFPFDAAASNFGGLNKYPYRFCKVYRKTFAIQPLEVNQSDLPNNLLNYLSQRIDVTKEYTQTFNLSIPLTYSFNKQKKYAVICTFDRKKWAAQYYGEIENNKAYFNNMGANLVYLVMYYDSGNYYPATDPFILHKNGKITYISLLKDKKQEMLLLRKNPSYPSNDNNAKSLLDGKIQGSNRPDFSDAITLYTIKSVPIKFEEVSLKNTKPFRYVRYVPPKAAANLAELEFYTNSSSTKVKGKAIGFPEIPAEIGDSYQDAFDGKLETFFLGNKDSLSYSWAGLDFGKPKKINRIKYAPRSDTNFIIIGNLYELFYWNKDHWASMGKQIATDQKIVFKEVPSKGLYILRNLSGGKEERTFTFENGKQIWW